MNKNKRKDSAYNAINKWISQRKKHFKTYNKEKKTITHTVINGLMYLSRYVLLQIFAFYFYGGDYAKKYSYTQRYNSIYTTYLTWFE